MFVQAILGETKVSEAQDDMTTSENTASWNS